MRHPVASLLALVVLASAAPTARASEGSDSPVLEPGKLLAPIVAKGRESSPTFRRMLDELATLAGSKLTVTQRAQPTTFVRAHSDLSIRRDGGFRVEGNILLPPAASGRELTALLAHELAHVLVMAGRLAREPDDPRDERLARSYEDAVREEMRGPAWTASRRAN